jgi:hypothetical protein
MTRRRAVAFHDHFAARRRRGFLNDDDARRGPITDNYGLARGWSRNHDFTPGMTLRHHASTQQPTGRTHARHACDTAGNFQGQGGAENLVHAPKTPARKAGFFGRNNSPPFRRRSHAIISENATNCVRSEVVRMQPPRLPDRLRVRMHQRTSAKACSQTLLWAGRLGRFNHVSSQKEDTLIYPIHDMTPSGVVPP